MITQSIIRRIVLGVLLAVAVGVAVAGTSAAEVRVGMSARETYVGLPVAVQIQVSNVSKIDPPALPDVDGLEIQSMGTPASSTNIMSINGRTTTSSSVTYGYQVTPKRAGSFRIPPIAIQADGRTVQTEALEFVASKSETGDLLFVEVAGKEKQIYVGQALDLTLKIWVRPFRDKEKKITLSEAVMWQLVSGQTSWGAFADRLHDLADHNQRPAGKEVIRKDGDGVEHSYYLYEIEATIYPKKPGKIDASDVRVIVDYPTAIGKSRDPFAGMMDGMQLPRGIFGDDDFPSPFGNRLAVQSVRPIVTEAAVEPIDVLPVPTAGRPDDYRGAVGEYQIVTEANPSTVKAGDPINLLIGVVGSGPMELVQAPPLAELPELTADFKVPNEPLAGFVKNDRKVFSTTIRPRKEGIAQIPAIPFSFFDPKAGKFVTVHSLPISIHVDPAEMLALDSVVGRHGNSGGGSKNAAAAESGVVGPLLAIKSGASVLQNEAGSSELWAWWMLVFGMPPAIVLAIGIARSGRNLFRFALLFESGMRRTRKQIENAESVADVSRVLRAGLARQLGVRGSANDADAVVGALRTGGYRNLAVRCERLLAESATEFAPVGVDGRAKLDGVKREALAIMDDLQTELQHRRPKPAPSKRTVRGVTRSGSATAIILAGLLLLGGGNAYAADVAEPSVAFTMEQKTSILSEANDAYNHALQVAAKDSVDAKQAFADSAEKYQLLVTSGVSNSDLYFVLANAYLQCGEKGKAIANYRRSLRLDPSSQESRANLAYAESAAKLPGASPSDASSWNWSDVVSTVNICLNQVIGRRIIGILLIAAWFALWLAVAMRLLGTRFPWKSVVAVAILVGSVSAASFWLSRGEFSRDVAIVATPIATLRTGDGDGFAAIDGAHLLEGQPLEVVKQRGEWLQVRTEAGQVGWILTPSVEIVGDRPGTVQQAIGRGDPGDASRA